MLLSYATITMVIVINGVPVQAQVYGGEGGGRRIVHYYGIDLFV